MRGFVFDGKIEPSCDFCGKEYKSFGIQMSFGTGDAGEYEICPTCVLKGPEVVAIETKKRPAREFHPSMRRWFMYIKKFANEFRSIGEFKNIHNGILAVKIAEAYKEQEKRKESLRPWERGLHRIENYSKKPLAYLIEQEKKLECRVREIEKLLARGGEFAKDWASLELVTMYQEHFNEVRLLIAKKTRKLEGKAA